MAVSGALAGLAGALRVPDDAVVYPPGLAAWLLEEARRAGAVVRLGEAVEGIVARAGAPV